MIHLPSGGARRSRRGRVQPHRYELAGGGAGGAGGRGRRGGGARQLLLARPAGLLGGGGRVCGCGCGCGCGFARALCRPHDLKGNDFEVVFGGGGGGARLLSFASTSNRKNRNQ